LLLGVFGTGQGVVYLLVYRAFAKGKVAVLNPVFASYSGVAALALVVLFGEALGGTQAALLVAVFAGVFVLSLESDSLHPGRIRLRTTPGLREILAATVLAGVWTVSWDRFVHGKSWLAYAAVMYVAMAVAIAVSARLQKVQLTVGKRSAWKFLVAIGCAEVAAYISISYGFSRSSHASVVALVSGSFSVPAVLLAWLFLKERVSRYQLAGIAVIVLGVGLLALTH
jgi:drug/metabolite transporter (DMT)-like permease